MLRALTASAAAVRLLRPAGGVPAAQRTAAAAAAYPASSDGGWRGSRDSPPSPSFRRDGGDGRRSAPFPDDRRDRGGRPPSDWRGGGRGGGGRGGPGGRGSFDTDRRDADMDAALRIPEATDAGAAEALAAAAAAAGVPTAVLARGRARLFREGGPVIYARSVDRLDGVRGGPPPASLPPGSPVAIADAGGSVFGWGWWNGASKFRVRVAALAGERGASPPFDTPALVRARIGAAAAARASLGLGGPGSTTDAYRLVNSEGDRLSGLVVDRLGPALVAVASAAWAIRARADIEAALKAAVPEADGGLFWSTAMEEEEGVAVAGSKGAGDDAGEHAGETDGGAAPPPTIVSEHGLRFTATPGRGQKTGFYADQRESRLFVRGLVRPASSVLDLCCFGGGFAVSAAAGGAASVTGVDSSAPALALASANAALNGVEDRCTWVRDDALRFARRAAADGCAWDLVVLDPPKLAPTRSALGPALRKYRTLNAAALACVADGGLLMTCSCSGAVAQAPPAPGGGSVFLTVLRAAAADAGVRLTVLRTAGAGPDHALDPAHGEGAYLTNVLVRVERL